MKPKRNLSQFLNINSVRLQSEEKKEALLLRKNWLSKMKKSIRNQLTSKRRRKEPSECIPPIKNYPIKRENFRYNKRN
jgi:uncharacterized protein YnzC (UPF0291/DUF896 family)